MTRQVDCMLVGGPAHGRRETHYGGGMPMRIMVPGIPPPGFAKLYAVYELSRRFDLPQEDALLGTFGFVGMQQTSNEEADAEHEELKRFLKAHGSHLLED